MAHVVERRKPLLARVRRIKGQVEALESVLDQDAECMAVLQQIAAIRGAVNGLMMEVMEGHLREHLGREGVSPQERAEEVEQIARVLRSYMK